MTTLNNKKNILMLALLLTLNVACDEASDLQKETLSTSSELSLESSIKLLEEAEIVNEVVENEEEADLLHGNGYKMYCSTSIPAEECADMIGISPEDADRSFHTDEYAGIFFREIKFLDPAGVEKTKYALWESKEAFEACGSIDMTESERRGIERNHGRTYTKITTGSEFLISEDCQRRNVKSGRLDLRNLMTEGMVDKTNPRPYKMRTGSVYQSRVSEHCHISDQKYFYIYTLPNNNVVMTFKRRRYQRELETGACDNLNIPNKWEKGILVLIKK